MSLEEIKKDLDEFMRELFYGFTTFVIVNPDQSKSQFYFGMLDGINKELRKDDPKANVLTLILDRLDEYRDNKLGEDKIKALHSMVIRLRSLGVIIHNNDAMSSLKMEKLALENENRKVIGENEILSRELRAYKEFVALQGKTLIGIK